MIRRPAKETRQIDTGVIFFFLRGGRPEDQAEMLFVRAEQGELELQASSEIHDDAISALRSGGASCDTVKRFLADERSRSRSRQGRARV